MSQTKLDIGIIDEKPKPPRAPVKLIRSLGHLVAIVESRELDPVLHKAVVKTIKGYPHGAYDYIFSHLDNIIAKCQDRLNVQTFNPEA